MTITAVFFLIVMVSSCCVDAHPMSGSTPQIEHPAAQKAEQPGDLNPASNKDSLQSIIERLLRSLALVGADTVQIKDIISSVSDQLRNLMDLAMRVTADDVPILQSGNSAPESGGTLKPVNNMNDLPGNLGAGNLPNVIGGGAGGH